MRQCAFLIPLLSIFVSWDFSYKVQVLHIYDGDTIIIGAGPIKEKLRISLIDAPELGQPYINGMGNAGEDSKKCLAGILSNKKSFRLHSFKRDIYQRLLGELDGVSEEFIKRGCGGLYPYAEFPNSSIKVKFIRLLDRAREKRLGVWNQGGYMRPYFWRKLKGKKKRYN